MYGLGVAVFLNPFAWVFIVPPVVVKGFSLSMLYQVAISIIGFVLVAKFLRDDIVEFKYGFRRALLQSLIYLAICLITPIFEVAYLYVVLGFPPPHLITTTPTPNDLIVLYTATYVPIMIAALMPAYAFVTTLLSTWWSRSTMRGRVCRDLTPQKAF
ncbi:hypothetical protein [Vulcanisaeta distributa]|uniref:hypothetical protein n=1 Tax=Vulcanisaeta distributa TaxID=164451 RepID=UPI001FB38879|nr:hypothetical protein [Vulcanisaeta distributa]